MLTEASHAPVCKCGCGRLPKVGKIFIHGHAGGRKQNFDNYLVVDCGHETPCWIWQGAKVKGAYGCITVGGKKLLAHRMMFIRKGGFIPAGLQLDHLCRNKACVNPDHLEPVTNQENIIRYFGVRSFCKNNHPLIGDNIMPTKGGSRARNCRQCNIERSRQWRAAKREGVS